jgi:hypothetical protein
MVFQKHIIFLVGIFALIFSGCSEETRQRLEPTPLAIGSINQLAVIADQDIWDGSTGDSVRYYFGSAYPILPQPESLFDLKHFTPAELEGEPTRQELKAYLILCDLGDPTSATTKMVMTDLGSEKVRRSKEDPDFSSSVARDKWANDQLLVYIFSHDAEILGPEIVRRFPAAAKIVQDHYENQIDATAYLGGENHVIVNTVQSLFGYYLKIPSDYFIALEEPTTLWLRKETDEASSNLILHKLPYRSQDQFEKEKIISLRDSLGKKLISSTIPGTYMQTNDVDLPVFVQNLQIDNAYAVEARGIWEMVGDFMGGPFISYVVLDEKNSELLFIDGFVFAPGKRKRNYMLQLEHIVSTMKF